MQVPAGRLMRRVRRISRRCWGRTSVKSTLTSLPGDAELHRDPTPYAGVVRAPAFPADADWIGSPALRLAGLRGKVVLLYFGYTFCPDACPTTLSELKKVPAALGDRADEVQVVMVSVDPQRDTPEVLREYLSYFDPSFLGLTGTEEEVLAAATPLGIYFSAHEGSAATGYLVDHTTSVLAIDKDGYLRLLYSFETPGEDIAADAATTVSPAGR